MNEINRNIETVVMAVGCLSAYLIWQFECHGKS